MTVCLLDIWFQISAMLFPHSGRTALCNCSCPVAVHDTKDDSNGCSLCKEFVMKIKNHQYATFHFEQSITS